MQITLKPTSIIDSIKDHDAGARLPARIWEGVTEAGTPVKAWIFVVQPQTQDDEKLAEFDGALKEVSAARQLVSFDLRLVT